MNVRALLRALIFFIAHVNWKFMCVEKNIAISMLHVYSTKTSCLIVIIRTNSGFLSVDHDSMSYFSPHILLSSHVKRFVYVLSLTSYGGI